MSAELKPQPEEETNLWAKYEQLKSQLPEMTPAEHEAACQRIAKELGI